MSAEVIAPLAGVVGAILGAILTGIMKARERRTELINVWLQNKRGLANGFMQHIDVHCRDGKLSDDDIRLVAQYYELGLAVSDDKAAVALYDALPKKIQARVHHPAAAPFDQLRSEVTPARKRSRVLVAPPPPPVPPS